MGYDGGGGEGRGGDVLRGGWGGDPSAFAQMPAPVLLRDGPRTGLHPHPPADLVSIPDSGLLERTRVAGASARTARRRLRALREHLSVHRRSASGATVVCLIHSTALESFVRRLRSPHQPLAARDPQPRLRFLLLEHR